MTPSQVELSISTASQTIANGNTPAQVPKLTMNGNAFPQPQGGTPSYSSGFQVVVIDAAGDMTDPASIRSNRYQVLVPDSGGSWWDTYQYMYNAIKRQLLTSGNIESQLIFLVSYGMDVNAPPTPDLMEDLLAAGAGPQLQKWETSVDIGSGGGDFISWPGNYVLVGRSMLGYGEGTEEYDFNGGNPVQTTVNVTLSNP